jgi:hypothetical protein
MLKLLVVFAGLGLWVRAESIGATCSAANQYNSDVCRAAREYQRKVARTGPNATSGVSVAKPQQDLIPVNPGVLPLATPFWRLAAEDTQLVVGIRPQFVSSSAVVEKVLQASGGLASGGIEAFRKRSQGIELLVIAASTGKSPLILARGADIIHAVKAEHDPLRYLDPQTIVVGNGNETLAAIQRILSPAADHKDQFLASVARWSDVWIRADASMLEKLAPGATLQGVEHLTIGMSTRDEMTMEAWLEMPSASAASLILAQLMKNPQSAPFVDGLPGADIALEQVDSAVRVYAHARLNISQTAPGAAPASGPSPEPMQRKTAVIMGLDDEPREIRIH